MLDTNDRAELSFDDAGVCNHCRSFDAQWGRLPPTPDARRRTLDEMVAAIKRAGTGRPYDCILGLSGGVDSTYVAYLAKQLGLRPLAVHFDNGWNSELAVSNIEQIVNRLDLDLSTHVVNWEEFKQLQLAYLRASVIDIEVLTDHAIYGTLYRLAIEKRIPFVLSGNNVATEGVLPYVWTYRKLDHINIRDIQRRFGRGTVHTYPFVDLAAKRRIRRSGIQVLYPLDLVPYVNADVKALLQRELGWRDYGGKHYESIFTRFYQGYILPTKFGIDKRKAHLASLICSGQITKRQALEDLARPAYDPQQCRSDMEFVLKKLGLTREEFDRIMSAPPRDHREFRVEGSLFNEYPALRPLRPLWVRAKRVLGIGSAVAS